VKCQPYLLKSDAIGLVLLATEIGLLIPVFISEEMPIVIWIVIYLVFAITAIYCWHSDKSPKTPGGWLEYAAGSVVPGGISFACDVWIGRIVHPNLPLLDAAKETIGPFGFGLTLIVFPGLTFISIAGIARAYFLSMKRAEA
jgi:hypothetical protein